MPLPTLQVMGIATADPSLFAQLMAEAGFRITPRTNDPHNNSVQEEAVAAVASAITENTQYGVRLSTYHRKLKTLAEQAGYVVMIENCGPPGADPCAGDPGTEEGFANGMEGDDMVPLAEVGEGEAMVAAGEGGPMEPPPMDDGESSEIQQIAALPLGTELAAEIMAVLQGQGTDALMGGDEGLHGEMPMGGEEFGGEEELPPAPEEGGEFGGEEELPPAPEEGEEETTRPF